MRVRNRIRPGGKHEARRGRVRFPETAQSARRHLESIALDVEIRVRSGWSIAELVERAWQIWRTFGAELAPE